MSTETWVSVSCDNPSCGEILTWSRKNEGGLNASTALDWAKRKGWSASGHRTFCPEHRIPRCEFMGYRWLSDHIGTGQMAPTRVRCAGRLDHKGDHHVGAYKLMAERTEGNRNG